MILVINLIAIILCIVMFFILLIINEIEEKIEKIEKITTLYNHEKCEQKKYNYLKNIHLEVTRFF
jgi:hypothetical protein